MGVALLVCAALFVWTTVAIYRGDFTRAVRVQLRTLQPGTTLKADSDVKVRGVVVGHVERVTATGSGALVDLSLQPDKAAMLPANVTAQLLPTTLFGERSVFLQPPPQPSAARLASGDVITQDRTSSAVEVDKVLSDTMPVLQALHPEELASTLNSLHQALAGRGRPLGETLTELNSYVARMNPSVPALKQDLHQLIGVAQTYQHAAPQVLEAMRNLSTTSRTLVEQRQNLQNLTSQITTSSIDGATFLEDNRNNLIRLNTASRPTLDVLAKYAPEYPCLFGDLAHLIPRINQVAGVGTDEPGVHIKLEVTRQDRGNYRPGLDKPRWSDKRGPRCYDNFKPPLPQYPPDGPFQDGASVPRDTHGLPPDGPEPPRTPGAATTAPQSADGLGVVNSPGERVFVAELLAPTTGTSPRDLPDWSSLLVGPLLRGAQITYQ
jgi:virulence factor Mce-like protein